MRLESLKPGDLLITRCLEDNLMWLLIGITPSTEHHGKFVTFWWSMTYCCIVVIDRADSLYEFPEHDYIVICQR